MSRFVRLPTFLALGLLAVVAVLVAATTLGGVQRSHAGDIVECTEAGAETGCITLVSSTEGDVHTVIAAVTAIDDVTPVQGVDLYIFVIKGPNAGERIGPENAGDGVGLTNASGQVTLTYTGDGSAGTDKIGAKACFEGGCGFAASNSFMDNCVADPDPCINTFFVSDTCDGSVDDRFICAGLDHVIAGAAAPTPTPPQLPATGGAPSDSGSSALPWLAVTAGALALMGSGSAWLAYQRRRVR